MGTGGGCWHWWWGDGDVVAGGDGKGVGGRHGWILRGWARGRGVPMMHAGSRHSPHIPLAHSPETPVPACLPVCSHILKHDAWSTPSSSTHTPSPLNQTSTAHLPPLTPYLPPPPIHPTRPWHCHWPWTRSRGGWRRRAQRATSQPASPPRRAGRQWRQPRRARVRARALTACGPCGQRSCCTGPSLSPSPWPWEDPCLLLAVSGGARPHHKLPPLQSPQPLQSRRPPLPAPPPPLSPHIQLAACTPAP